MVFNKQAAVSQMKENKISDRKTMVMSQTKKNVDSIHHRTSVPSTKPSTILPNKKSFPMSNKSSLPNQRLPFKPSTAVGNRCSAHTSTQKPILPKSSKNIISKHTLPKSANITSKAYPRSQNATCLLVSSVSAKTRRSLSVGTNSSARKPTERNSKVKTQVFTNGDEKSSMPKTFPKAAVRSSLTRSTKDSGQPMMSEKKGSDTSKADSSEKPTTVVEDSTVQRRRSVLSGNTGLSQNITTINNTALKTAKAAPTHVQNGSGYTSQNRTSVGSVIAKKPKRTPVNLPKTVLKKTVQPTTVRSQSGLVRDIRSRGMSVPSKDAVKKPQGSAVNNAAIAKKPGFLEYDKSKSHYQILKERLVHFKEKKDQERKSEIERRKTKPDFVPFANKVLKTVPSDLMKPAIPKTSSRYSHVQSRIFSQPTKSTNSANTVQNKTNQKVEKKTQNSSRPVTFSQTKNVNRQDTKKVQVVKPNTSRTHDVKGHPPQVPKPGQTRRSCISNANMKRRLTGQEMSSQAKVRKLYSNPAPCVVAGTRGRRSILKTDARYVRNDLQNQQRVGKVKDSCVRFQSPADGNVVAMSTAVKPTTSQGVRTPIRKRLVSMREKLDAWLTAQGKTPSRYLRLRYCGAHLDESSKEQTKQPNRKVRGGLSLKQLMEQQEHLSSESDEASVAETSEHRQVTAMLEECMHLCQADCPIENVLEWMDQISESFPASEKMAKYWICRARITEKQGDDDATLRIFEEAVRKNAQPAEEVADEIKRFVERKNAPQQSGSVQRADIHVRIRSDDLDEENMFQSSAVRYLCLTPATPVFKRMHSLTSSGVVHVVTPVRRSTRKSNSTLPRMLQDHHLVLESLDDLSADKKQTSLYQPNEALVDKFSVDLDISF